MKWPQNVVDKNFGNVFRIFLHLPEKLIVKNSSVYILKT